MGLINPIPGVIGQVSVGLGTHSDFNIRFVSISSSADVLILRHKQAQEWVRVLERENPPIDTNYEYPGKSSHRVFAGWATEDMFLIQAVNLNEPLYHGFVILDVEQAELLKEHLKSWLGYSV